MKVTWSTHPRIIRAQIEVWTAEKQLWMLSEIARFAHRALGYGIERQKVIAALKAATKALEAL